MIFQWSDGNEEHIAKHGVRPSEAQYVVEHALPPFPRGIEDEKQLVWGQTEAGRFLQVIFVYLADEQVDFPSLSPVDRIGFQGGEVVRLVIHAMSMTNDQKRQYRRLKRQ